jgi:eukaryotic-like serine/threonine-protein kinase
LPVSYEQFVKSLSDSGLLADDELVAIVGRVPRDERGINVEEFAKDLVRNRKLTRYQASVLYQGQARSLIFGDYVIVDKIGSGAMGQVFKAQHRRLKRFVALKVLRASSAKSEKSVKRFQREAEAAAKLTHANIVAVYDAGEMHGTHYIVMQYVEGRDLQSFVKQNGPLPFPTAVSCIIQAAQGLDFAHRQGIVHRDIKPSNLLLDSEGHVTVLDMGLARIDEVFGEGDAMGQLTIPGQMMGTVNFVSPEQAIDAHSVDARSDIYSLGCTLYYLLTGKPPYQKENMALTLLAHAEAPIPNVREEVAGAPEELDLVFQRLLAKQAGDRYADMAQVIDGLSRCLNAAKGIRSPASAVVAVPLPVANIVRKTSDSLSETKSPVERTAISENSDLGAQAVSSDSITSVPDFAAWSPGGSQSGRSPRLGGGWITAIACALIAGLVALAFFLANGTMRKARLKPKVAAESAPAESVEGE